MLHPAMDLGADICKLFGVDPHTVSRIAIDLPAGDVPTVTFEGHLTDPDLIDGLKRVLQRYEIVPINTVETTALGDKERSFIPTGRVDA